MAEKNNSQEAAAVQTASKTKGVRNRSGHRVELVIDGKVVVFLPGKVTEVPMDFQVPNGLGLYVR
jgi:hypothetical protein